jgi:hypothetical protein
LLARSTATLEDSRTDADDLDPRGVILIAQFDLFADRVFIRPILRTNSRDDRRGSSGAIRLTIQRES